MDNGILTDIIAVEKEVRERLDAERERAAARLEQIRNDLEENLRREEERLRQSLGDALSAARNEAEHNAALLEREAAEQSERLARIDDLTLRRIVVEHLSRLMPEAGDDR
jgi:vacuolar-type H+-ATPase subunit H